MFGPAFLNNPNNEQAIERWRGIATSNSRVGVYRAGQAIFRRPNVLPLLGAVRTPTLLMTGADDTPTPVDAARRAQQAIPEAELTVIPAAGHSSPIERPEAVTGRLDAFITAHTAVPAS
jgi:pimeloyl-ACP methyl ester carboxylesterase